MEKHKTFVQKYAKEIKHFGMVFLTALGLLDFLLPHTFLFKCFHPSSVLYCIDVKLPMKSHERATFKVVKDFANLKLMSSSPQNYILLYLENYYYYAT